MQPLLPELAGRPWSPDAAIPKGLKPIEFYLSPSDAFVTVRVAEWSAGAAPKAADLEKLWTSIARKLRVVVLVVVRQQDGRTIADVVGGRARERDTKGFPKPLIRRAHEMADVRAFCRGVLGEPDQNAAGTFVGRWLDERATDLPGLKNDGLFAGHTLRTRVPHRSDWPDALDHAKRVREHAGRALVENLGFTIKSTEDPRAAVLVGEGGQRAVALFLEEHEGFDDPADSLARRTPVTHALAIARRLNVPWIVLTRGRSIRLHPVSADHGVGRRGRSTTYTEIDLRLLPEDRSAYLWLLFSAAALAEDGSAQQILADSSRYAADLGVRLRDRIYVDVVPRLAELVAERMRELGETDLVDDRWLDEAYRSTMVVLFRTLFVAYAEDRGLLPYERNERYTERSLKKVAQDLDKQIEDSVAFDEHDHSLWNSLVWTWTTVAKGNREVGVPQYGGGLFEVRAFLDRTLLTRPFSNAEIGPALAALLLDTDDEGELGPVDFRSLSVREFGTIYEGLLESELSVASQDLALDREKNYVPATPAAPRRPRSAKTDDIAAPLQPVVREGEVYFHNRSGARKSSGTYFTKPFVVEYLLDRALEPAIDDHLSRVKASLDAGDQAAAAARFFDFRVADIAMGSGHFLVAAIDRVEARFADFLATNDLPSVRRELDALRSAALSGLDGSDDAALIEDAALLRRQIARRCIYGVDLNRVAVELARLAVWIHTFVPGLPMSYLDHTLVVGNSLTGIGTLEEADAILETDTGRGGTATFASSGIVDALAKARPALSRLQAVADTTVTDVRAAAEADAEAREALRPLAELLDLLVLQRAGLAGVKLVDTSSATVRRARYEEPVVRTLQALAPLHYPLAFPEVFLRDRPGFDCLLGNPPWEKVKIEAHGWWSVREPRLRSLPVGEMNRRIDQLRIERPDLIEQFHAEITQVEQLRAALHSGPDQLGSGDADLFKAFAWRYWRLLAGRAGVVMPRGLLAASGNAEWRRMVLEAGGLESTALLANTRGWVFEEVHQQYTVALICLDRSSAREAVEVIGPVSSRDALQTAQVHPLSLPKDGLLGWTESAAFPTLPDAAAADVFLKMREHPRLDEESEDWAFRCLREFDATNDKRFMEINPDRTQGLWPVYAGSAFNLWEPDTGNYYAWADPDVVTAELQRRRVRSARLERSAWRDHSPESLNSPETLPCNSPRIAWRDVTNHTNQRTLISALIPPGTVLNHTAPYLLPAHSSAAAEAYLIGMLSSIVVDWYARRFVETHVTFDVLRGLPIPRPTDAAIDRRITSLAGRLSAVDVRFTAWAAAVGVQVSSIGSEPERTDSIDEIDALAALAYGLDEADLRLIFETFHIGWDFHPRLERVLEHFRHWSAP